MSTLTKPENTFKGVLEEAGFSVKFYADKKENESGYIYMQVPVLSYILDFACLEKKLAIEVDGEYWHACLKLSLTAPQLQRKLADTQKDEELLKYGWNVFRIPSFALRDRSKARLIQHLKTLLS